MQCKFGLAAVIVVVAPYNNESRFYQLDVPDSEFPVKVVGPGSVAPFQNFPMFPSSHSFSLFAPCLTYLLY